MRIVLHLGQNDEKFFLIKVSSFMLHAEMDESVCRYDMSNPFSINIYIAEDNDSKLLICADPLNSIQISIDHFQFEQIIRLQEMINDLATKIKTDRAFFSKRFSQEMQQTDLFIYALIDRILINIVLPPTSLSNPYSRSIRAIIPSSDTDESLSSS